MKKYLFLIALLIPFFTNAQLGVLIDAAQNYNDINIVNNNSRQVTPLKVNTTITKVLDALKYIDTANKFNQALTWNIKGNAGTIDATNFIGTTDNVPFNIRVNNVRSGRIDRIRHQVLLGYQAGLNITGSYNVAFGQEALMNCTLPNSYNTAVGDAALKATSTGEGNTAIGMSSMALNTTGSFNTALGAFTMSDNKGTRNIAIGYAAASNMDIGSDNVLIGSNVANLNTTGSKNIFIGRNAGSINTIGSNNTIIGNIATLGANNLTNATAIGANAQVNASNSLVFGSINGINGATSGTNAGFGTTTPTERLHIVGNLKIENGSQGFGKFLKSDADGVSIWATPPIPTLQDVLIAGSNFSQNNTINIGAYNFNITGDGAIGINSNMNDIDLSGQNVNINSNLQVTNTSNFSGEGILASKFDYATNIGASFTIRSLIDKGYADSIAALKLNIIDAYDDEKAQDAIGPMVDPTLIYNDGLPSLGRAAINGDITIAAGSNTAAITAGVIVNADINAGAAIDATKLIDGSISNTELGFINTLNANAQTQFNNINTNKVTKGGDTGPLMIGTNTADNLEFMAGNNNRWRITPNGGLLRTFTSSSFGFHLGGTGLGSMIVLGDTFALQSPYVYARENGGLDSDQWEFYAQKGYFIRTGTDGSTSNLNVAQNGSVCIGTETPIAATKLTIVGATNLAGNLIQTGNTTQTGILDITGNAAISGFIRYKNSATPSSPAVGECNEYVKGGKKIWQYNDGGTIRYKYLDLSGIGVTIVHTLVAP